MKKITVILLSFMMLHSGINSAYAQSYTDSAASIAHDDGKKNILMVNPIHLASCNYTFSYLRFIREKESFLITLSGSEKENYIAISADLNYYPALPSSVNYFIGGSLLGYESAIKPELRSPGHCTNFLRVTRMSIMPGFRW